MATAELTNTKVEEVQAKKKSDEDKIHDIIWESLFELRSNVVALNKAIKFNEENPRKLAILINSRAKVQQQIFYCVTLLGNPKLKLMTDSGRNKDFARMMKQAVLEDNPAVKRMVEEAKQKPAPKSAELGGEVSSNG